MKCRGKHDTTVHEIFRVVSRFPRYTFHVISRKVDFRWDSVGEDTFL